MLGTLFFAGPTGVGKTEIAKALAEILLGDREAITKIACENFQESHTGRDLLGAPQSYVGFGTATSLSPSKLFSHIKKAEKEGKIHSVIRGLPNFSILVFDEIEKMHPDIVQSLLGFLNEGKIQFPNGTTGSYENTLVIFTSNVGQAKIRNENSKGTMGFIKKSFGDDLDRNIALEEMKNVFSPEFMGRLNEIIHFDKLNEQDKKDILEKCIRDTRLSLQKYFTKLQIDISLDDTVKQIILSEAFNTEYGARQFNKIFKARVLAPLGNALKNPEMQNLMETSKFITIVVSYDKELAQVMFQANSISSHFLKSDKKQQNNPLDLFEIVNSMSDTTNSVGQDFVLHLECITGGEGEDFLHGENHKKFLLVEKSLHSAFSKDSIETLYLYFMHKYIGENLKELSDRVGCESLGEKETEYLQGVIALSRIRGVAKTMLKDMKVDNYTSNNWIQKISEIYNSIKIVYDFSREERSRSIVNFLVLKVILKEVSLFQEKNLSSN